MNDDDKAEVDAIGAAAELLEAPVEARRGNATKPEDGSPTSRFNENVWQELLATPDGAATVAGALAKHLHESITPSGPQHEWTGTSLEKVIEVLEACGARLQEFRPDGMSAVDLTRLGRTPFAKLPDHERYQPCCSFCGKSQKEVARLLAGPMVNICNGCVEMCSRLINEFARQRGCNGNSLNRQP